MPDSIEDQAPGLTVEGAVATLTLRRPSQHNRIAPEDSDVVRRYLSQLETMPGLRLLIITGTGEKTFSSGYTLGAIRDQLDDRFEDMLDHLERFPLPTLCVLNGSVYGGATDLALCCDFRIGVRGSRMLMPASRIGLHYYPGGIRRYVTVLGLAAAKKLFLTAQAIGDKEMLRIGFLNELVPPSELGAAVRAYVDGIVASESKVMVTMKADLMSQAAGVADEATLRRHYAESLRSPELAMRLEAFDKAARK
ncbi:MAG TPA: enoyl-CoA hydratase/isomerase family protein [Burkholderiaceae bacterium]|jgi:enoyl-CoA hydratase/carnithine racemase|nr:enoyl-CoA hydratase/isomerase family protein [Burkholderiaceae bacterium]